VEAAFDGERDETGGKGDRYRKPRRLQPLLKYGNIQTELLETHE
jgi:hypothetical protein